MSVRVTLAEALRRGWIRREGGGRSTKAVNTAQGTPQATLYGALRDAGIEVEWEKPGLIPGRRFVVDLYLPAVRGCIEIDGFRYHRSRKAFQHDRRRQNLLVIHGYAVLRYFAGQILDPVQRESVIDEIRALLDR